ncbi:MAG: aldo/keto reductase [Actinomycetota bacterium]|nr:aldo/keto reductase [Actinomycetota bacterium]
MALSPTVTLNNGVEIPQLGFGVFQVSNEDIIPTVQKALEVGYRHIDTAAAYGNEEGVGKAIANAGIPRDEVFVTTKLWNSEQGSDSALAAFDQSLARLGLDHVDLYLIHWPTPENKTYVDTWKAMEGIYADGRARAIGVSNFQANHLHHLIRDTTVVPAINQIELHPTFTQSELVGVHAELGIHTEAWSPLGQAADLESGTVTEIASRLGKSTAQVVIRWHLQLGYIVFPKSVTPSRIESNFDVFDFELSDADVTAISALDSGNRIGPDPDTFN